MKKFILLLPTTIFPYSFFVSLYCFFKGIGNLGESFSFLPWLFALALICNIVFSILSIWKKWDFRQVALCNMAVKLIQIPAYICIFILGVLCFSTLFTIGFAIIPFLSDCASILLTGLIGVVSIIRGYSSNAISKKFSIVNGILQFVFCVDLISAIVIFAKAIHKSKSFTKT